MPKTGLPLPPLLGCLLILLNTYITDGRVRYDDSSGFHGTLPGTAACREGEVAVLERAVRKAAWTPEIDSQALKARPGLQVVILTACDEEVGALLPPTPVLPCRSLVPAALRAACSSPLPLPPTPFSLTRAQPLPSCSAWSSCLSPGCGAWKAQGPYEVSG